MSNVGPGRQPADPGSPDMGNVAGALSAPHPAALLKHGHTRKHYRARPTALLAIGAGVCIGIAGVSGWLALAPPVNDRAASLCRSVIPALNPPGANFTIGSAKNGAFGQTLRIIYVAHFSDGRVRAREVACSYAAPKADEAQVRLTGVATERGPLNEANFYFLRRFYLEARDGPPPDPAGSQARAPRN